STAKFKCFNCLKSKKKNKEHKKNQSIACFNCRRCYYDFKLDLFTKINLKCPYCGKYDQVEKKEFGKLF
ncbi:MAG: hypothetical protein ACMXX8_02620, partial [Candidatus Woesearchaeota archaeon]